MNKEPGHRYQVGSEVHAALEALHGGRPLSEEATAAEAPSVPVSPSGPQRPSTASLASVRSSERSETISVTLSRRRAVGFGVTAAVVLVSGLAAWQLWPTGAATRSLAVLPFENVLSDEETDYLAEGVAESLIRRVSSLPSVAATPLSAVLNFSQLTVEPRDAGRQLGVDAVLSGTLSLEAGQLAITTELVDVESGVRLWSNTYDRDVSELLDIQDEIAGAILDDGLRVELSSDERSELVRGPTRDGEAFDLFLQARYLQRRGFEDDYLDARELLERRDRPGS